VTLQASDFDYSLPGELIAQAPLPRREQSRLMVVERASGRIEHHVFKQLPDLLQETDLVVFNDTKVIPARFFLRRATGGKIDGLFVREPRAGIWQVMLRGAGRCREGQDLLFPDAPPFRAQLLRNLGEGHWELAVSPATPAVELLEAIGQTPLPPYIRRPDGDRADDRRRYQTVYATRPGAVAAPTAGLHFTGPLLERLRRRGVEQVNVTLHVGPGTFLPVKSEDLRRHRMHAEWFELSPSAAEALNAARRAGRRVVAVGTTSVRVVESAARSIAAQADEQSPRDVFAAGRAGQFAPLSAWTDLFLYPPADFLAVDALITNFHLPRSTLLMLVTAFAGPGGAAGLDLIKRAYAEAVAQRYRFYSYGDAMLIR